MVCMAWTAWRSARAWAVPVYGTWHPSCTSRGTHEHCIAHAHKHLRALAQAADQAVPVGGGPTCPLGSPQAALGRPSGKAARYRLAHSVRCRFLWSLRVLVYMWHGTYGGDWRLLLVMDVSMVVGVCVCGSYARRSWSYMCVYVYMCMGNMT